MPGKLVNKTELAATFGVSHQTLTAWQNEGMPFTKNPKIGEDNEYDTADCIRWWGKRELRSHGKFDLNDEKSKLAREQTEHARRKNELAQGNVILLTTAKETLAVWIAGARKKILQSKLSRDEKQAILRDLRGMKGADLSKAANDDFTEPDDSGAGDGNGDTAAVAIA